MRNIAVDDDGGSVGRDLSIGRVDWNVGLLNDSVYRAIVGGTRVGADDRIGVIAVARARVSVARDNNGIGDVTLLEAWMVPLPPNSRVP